jgi:membrane protein implicated in regulation of membrane protease activity
VVVGVIAVCWQKPLIIMTTAFLGAYFLFYGIDVFAATGFAAAVESILRGEPTGELATETLLMLIFAGVAAVLGALVQLRTGRDKDHRQKTADTVYIKIN